MYHRVRIRLGVALGACAILATAGAVLAGTQASAEDPVAAKRSAVSGLEPTSRKREVIIVGNNWEGTADVINAKNFRHIARLDIVPDLEERLAEIYTNPVRLGFFLGIREAVGEGNDQFVDDLYTTHDGRLLVVSRPSLADVVAIEIATGEIVWRFVVDGQRSDHMAISPDGEHVAVSASTGNVVHILDTRTGEEAGKFASGDSPHENVYSADGERIFHASIGRVYTPTDHPALDTSKGDQRFQIVDAETSEIIEKFGMGEKLAEAGYEDMSSAVRPIAIAPNEKRMFAQVSFFHGFVEYSFIEDKVVRVVELPVDDDVPSREGYLLDSAHHGIAISGDGRRLCVAGTMSDYAAIVERSSLKSGEPQFKRFDLGVKPYWSTTSLNGKRCYVSWSGTDSISVLSYRKRKEIAHIPVGDHPQRVRTGLVRRSFILANR